MDFKSHESKVNSSMLLSVAESRIPSKYETQLLIGKYLGCGTIKNLWRTKQFDEVDFSYFFIQSWSSYIVCSSFELSIHFINVPKPTLLVQTVPRRLINNLVRASISRKTLWIVGFKSLTSGTNWFVFRSSQLLNRVCNIS